MGCDIHGPYLEQIDQNGNWNLVAKLDWWRDYSLFGLMAGVRGDGEGQPCFDPKGFPNDTHWSTKCDYGLYVKKENDAQEGYCSQAKAAEWIESGCSDVLIEREGEIIMISGPDWHSASWLSTQEVKLLIERYKSAIEATVEEMRKHFEELKQRHKDFAGNWEAFNPMNHENVKLTQAAYNMMRELETPSRPCRLVFWFDN